MKKVLLGLALASTTLITGVVAVSASGGVNAWGYMRAANYGYSCNDIVFSETVDNPNSSADLSDVSTVYTTTLNCSMTGWSNANYKAESAIKIGGSKSGKYSGSVKLTLNDDVAASRLIIYAAGWVGDSSDLQLGVNGRYQDVTATATGDSYVFSPYTFDLGSQVNEITFTNNPSATGKSRIVISKIVLRLHSGGGGGSTSVIPPSTSVVPPSTSSSTSVVPTPSTVTFEQSELAVSSSTISKGGITLENSSTYTASVTELRIYKGETLTITSTTAISSIEFTCTANDTAKYGPGCFIVDGGTYSYSARIGTWTGNATSITFTASTNQVRITQIVITL